MEDIECTSGGAFANSTQTESIGGSEGVRVSSLTDWGPACKSVMRVGDVIEKVSGYDVKGLSANFVQHLIKGPSGKCVRIQPSKSPLVTEYCHHAGTAVTIDARHCQPSKQGGEAYSVTLIRMRWPERERTLMEKGSAACECISSMKEEIRLLVGQIDDLEGRLDEETSHLMHLLDDERRKVARLERALEESSTKWRDQERAAVEMRQSFADAMSARDKKLALLEAGLQARMREMARSLEEQISTAQLLRIRQSKLVEGYDARMVELQETAQAVANSVQQAYVAPRQLLSQVRRDLAGLQALAGKRFEEWRRATDAMERHLHDCCATARLATAPARDAGGGAERGSSRQQEKRDAAQAGEWAEAAERSLNAMEEKLSHLENDVSLMRTIAGAIERRDNCRPAWNAVRPTRV